MTGEGPSRPLNPEWDRALLETLARADWATTDSFTAESVDAVAGAGGNEILCWVAATAALATAGSFDVVQKDYIDVPGWIAGMAHFAEVADIFRRHGPSYAQAHDGHLVRVERRVMSAIELCRTAALGGHVEAYEDCAHASVAYNSCLMGKSSNGELAAT
ncbi:hypothetical protein Sbs19_40760 [Sphingobium sp. BS19]|nr:hypothetical protein Sbs19_40760 [Sphingobium sp. BS19]